MKIKQDYKNLRTTRQRRNARIGMLFVVVGFTLISIIGGCNG